MILDRPDFEDLAPGKFPVEGYDTCELKYDGWWGQLLIEGSRWEIYSRTGLLKKSGILNKEYDRTLLHGEYCYGTEWSKDRPKFYDKVAIHTATSIDGVDTSELSLLNCGLEVALFLKKLADNSESIRRGLLRVSQFDSRLAEVLWNRRVLSGDKFEGLVFKNQHDIWGSLIGRMKNATEMDYVCIGFEQSDSDRYEGVGVRSVIGGLYVNGSSTTERVCRVGGLNDAQRIDMYNNPLNFIGRVFKASGKKVSKKGALRHPSFEGWRDDKPVKDCIWPRSRIVK